MSASALKELDGLVQVIHTESTKYVLLSKVQYDSLWTVEIGTIGEHKPQWWRCVLDVDEFPKSLVRIGSHINAWTNLESHVLQSPERITAAIIGGEIHLTGMTTAASPKVRTPLLLLLLSPHISLSS